MSAIYGILGEADPGEIEAMGLRLMHRGTNERRWTPAPRVHFGLRTLATEGEPHVGLPILFDGFLDNIDEIADALGWTQAEARARGEARASFEIFRKLGRAGFERLSGQFALAIWDEGHDCLLLVRDRFGARPIHYGRAGGRLLFASEYKALLAIDDLPARPNPDAIQYLHCTRYNKTDETFLVDVLPVPPGHWVEISDGSMQKRRYWSTRVRVAPLSVKEHAAAVRDTMLDCARRQTERHDPVGVSLSGGLDSAATLAAIRHVWPEKTVHTFCAGFGAQDREIIDAAAIAGHFRTRHHEIVLDPEELPLLVEPIVWYLEDPAGREETAFLYVTSQEAMKYVDILMTGYAADALFAGMPRHLLVNKALRYPLLRRPLEDFFNYTQASLPPRSLPGRLLTRLYFRGRQWPAPRVIGAERLPVGTELKARGSEPLSEFLLRCLTQEPSLESKVERLHSPFGIAFNAPFMDTNLIDCAFKVPDRHKIHGAEQKYILRRACTGLLPNSVLNRKKTLQKLKHDLKFSDVLDRLVETYLSTADLAARGLFEKEYVDKLISRRAGKAYPSERAYRIWSIVLTEVWARLFLDRRGEPPTSPTPSALRV